MAHAYTPGLSVLEATRVRRERRLPIEGEVVVTVGQRVHATDVVAKTEIPGAVYPINLANKLGILPADVASCLEVKVGDLVERGQTLARSKGLWGLFRTPLPSPVTARVESISSVTGQMMLRLSSTPLAVLAYIEGEVVDVTPGDGCVVETVASLVQGIIGVGGEKEGVLAALVDSPDVDPSPDDVKDEHKDKILVAGRHVSLAVFQRAAEVGARGLIAGSISDSDLVEILGYDLGVAITGSEKLPTTLIATEGFGSLPMAERTFKLLVGHAGRTASINGATQIRAGVIRPEIVVPLGPEARPRQAEAGEEGRLEIGTRLRVVREPYFGLLGRVAALPHEPIVIETEARVRVLDVHLDDGRTVTLPRANVELVIGG
ncbi:hypothetical protein HS125_02235 [bacterium]|nr:hypothetical protein [bacterium]